MRCALLCARSVDAWCAKYTQDPSCLKCRACNTSGAACPGGLQNNYGPALQKMRDPKWEKFGINLSEPCLPIGTHGRLQTTRLAGCVFTPILAGNVFVGNNYCSSGPTLVSVTEGAFPPVDPAAQIAAWGGRYEANTRAANCTATPAARCTALGAGQPTINGGYVAHGSWGGATRFISSDGLYSLCAQEHLTMHLTQQPTR